MPHSIESIASTRKKTKEVIRVESLFPSELREKAANLIGLLQDYYAHLNEQNQASYEINSINNSRDIDEADEKYISLLQKEIAINIPKNTVADRVRLYKNLVRYYGGRGSQESITQFFRILFQDNVEVYYPYTDTLIPSSGTWQTSLSSYADNTGFLSDEIKLQDSYFYQKFSYVIRTGNSVDVWGNLYNRLVHPAGFIFFGQILILIELLNGYAKMPKVQPGFIGIEDVPFEIILEVINSSAYRAATALFTQTYYKMSIEQPSGASGSDMVYFYDENSINLYKNVAIEDAFILDSSGTINSGYYPYGEWTFDDLINNTYYWNDIELGIVS